MPKPGTHRRRLIVAPESPPVTSPPDLPDGRMRNAFHPAGPRAIVQRSNFSLKNPIPLPTRPPSRHPSRYDHATPSAAHSHRSSNPGSIGTPVFKLDEELQNSFHLGRHSSRYHSGTPPDIRRSESMEAIPAVDDTHHGRFSESEPPQSSILMSQMSALHRQTAASSSRRSLDVPRPSRPRNQLVSSAPIKIPSRAKQEEERRKHNAAMAKAKAVAANSSRTPRHQSRSSRSSLREPKHRPYYSSSDDDEELVRKRH